ncbi:MAG: imidazole glycerol phosphate synthase subunit HisH [Rhodospirillaceae bacterium]|jgi:imidazole glycerol-phosphate synthase subunit HisH|nr:imidazole glycerol phosphate synthase subunit HisH [Rhodospirillaceae bacterium]MBT6428733.1 imidazole glycerol phosphate synthase subunit HisH [Rhodospirillaceae bacterium]MBT7760313.1 imidazole glycerol phosphate synthase subunit HisH [Rhodospirillaceae bacterium]
MKQVAIIDYGSCNLDSIARAVENCGGRPFVTDEAEELARADQIILPGVGSYVVAMENLKAAGMDLAIRAELARRPVPFLGICLGMQLLTNSSLEDGFSEGLGLIDGKAERLSPTCKDERIPHMGWNEVVPARDNGIFDGVVSGSDFYFANSYHVTCDDQYVLAHTPYCGGFISAVAKDNLIGLQFHPEKSQGVGFQVLRNFLQR